MPSVSILNASGGAVQLHQLGGATHNFPAGFGGSVTLEGHYSAAMGGSYSQQVTSNGVPYMRGFTGSITLNDTSGFGGSLYYANMNTGTPLRYISASTGNTTVGYVGDYEVQQVNVMPSTGSLLVEFSYNPTDWQHYTYSTNLTLVGGVSLGSFTVGTMLREVTLHPTTLSVATYEAESGWVALGFGLGLTVLLFRYILRLLRAIPTQGGDF